MKGLIIWAQSNCRSTMALYRELIRILEVPVVVALWHYRAAGQSDIRTCIGFRDDEFSDIEMVPVGEDLNKGLSLLNAHPGYNHLFAVYQGAKTFQKLILEAKRRGENVGIMCESPCNMASGFKFLLKEAYMRYVLPCRVSRIVKNADFFVNLSGDDSRAAERNGWPKAKVLPFGYFSPRIEGSELTQRKSNRPFEILATGILAPYRGADILLTALSILSQRGVGYHATITQKGPMYDKMRAYVQACRLPVDMPGFVEMNDLVRLYQTCSVYVGAGRREPWGMRLNDALQCGAPLVVSRGMGGVQLVDCYGCGLSVPPADPVALADALQRLIEDADLYAHVAHKAFEAGEACAPERKAQELLSLIHAFDPSWMCKKGL